MPVEQYQAWMFTCHNLEQTYELNDKIRFLCYQHEHSPLLNPVTGNDGLPHQQGYVEFHQKCSMKACSDALGLPWAKAGSTDKPFRTWFAKRSGTQQHAIEYCTNERYCETHHCGDEHLKFCNCPDAKLKGRIAGPWQLGEIVTQGQRRDIEQIALRLRAGEHPSVIAAECPFMFIKYHKGIQALHDILAPKKTWKPYVVWCSGPTGVRKSRMSRAILSKDSFVKMPGNGWFDGYTGQDVAIFDDFRKDWFTYGFLLNLLDHGEMRNGIKGATVQWRPRVVLITCNRHWTDLYTKDDTVRDDISQLTRRVDLDLRFPMTDAVYKEHIWSIRRRLVEMREGKYEDVEDEPWDGVTIPACHLLPQPSEPASSSKRSRSPRASDCASDSKQLRLIFE